MSIGIREVMTEEERQAVFRLRYPVYVEEMGDRQRYADHRRRTLDDPLDATGHILAAFDEGRVVGSVRVNLAAESDFGEYADLHGVGRLGPYYPGRVCMTTKLVLQPEYRGGRTAVRLAQACMDLVANPHGMRFDLIDCKPDAQRFFHRLGYRQVAPDFRHPDTREIHRPLILAVFDRDYFERIRSPFLQVMPECAGEDPSVRFFYECLAPDGSAPQWRSRETSGGVTPTSAGAGRRRPSETP
jgi:predicted GNAT family N-acyltransferase